MKMIGFRLVVKGAGEWESNKKLFLTLLELSRTTVVDNSYTEIPQFLVFGTETDKLTGFE